MEIGRITIAISVINGEILNIMISTPKVVTAVITSIANLSAVANAARLAVKTLLWFAGTALIAVIIGIVLGVVGAALVLLSRLVDEARALQEELDEIL